MKTVIRILSVLSICVLALTGCGNSGNTASGEAADTAETTEAAVPASEAAETTYGNASAVDVSAAAIGDIIKFGTYEQDNDTSDGKEDIEWIVLDKADGKLLVISKYALDSQKYNEDHADITWETCTLRSWLNNDFLNTAFSSDEIAQIATTTVTAEKNPDYDIDAGNDTQDQVFLLSISEAEKYFSSNIDRKCIPTAYAIAQGARLNYGAGENGEDICWWWLRTPGEYTTFAANVATGGTVMHDGHGAFDKGDCIRPALWINLET